MIKVAGFEGMMVVGRVLLAAGILALTGHVERLAEDHRNARRLADGLSGLAGIEVDPGAVQTNMVFVRAAGSRRAALQSFLAERGILVGGYGDLRLVTHLDVDSRDVDRVVDAFADCLSQRGT